MLMECKEGGFSANLKVGKKYDVAVVGGGPAGIVSALAARRNGANTLLIERFSMLGGNMTAGGIGGIPVAAWRGDAKDNPLLVKGIGEEIINRLVKEKGALEWNPTTRKVVYDPWIMAYVLDEIMQEANIDVLFDTAAFDAVVENNVIKGVAIANKSGGQVILANVVIDCSGDADIAAAAGAPFEVGRPQDGRHHGGAMDVVFGGIDVDKFIEFLKSQPDMTEEERKELEDDRQRLIGGGGPPNTARSALDGSPVYREFTLRKTDWKEVEQARKEGRPIQLRMATESGGPFGIAAVDKNGKYLTLATALDTAWINYIKEGNVPPLMGAAKLVFPPPRFGFYGGKGSHGVVGVFRFGKWRHDQMYSGVYECWYDQTNTEEISKALMHMRKINMIYLKFLREHAPGFENAYIAEQASTAGTRESRRIIGEYMINEPDEIEGRRFPDVIAKGGHHGPDAHPVTGVWGDGTFSPCKRPYDIPYRCLVPKKIDNLLVPGRSKSATALAYAASRSQAVMFVTGEAAGTAAALSVKLGVTPRNVDIKLLQKTLIKQGALLFFDDEKEKEKEVLEYNPPAQA